MSLSPAPHSLALRAPACAFVWALCLGALSAASAPAAPARVGAPPAPSTQDAKPKRPDQVAVRSRRGDSVSQVYGAVSENSLENVLLTTSAGQEKVASELVVRVTFGDVPPSFRDGVLYRERGEFALAAGSFLQAAGDGGAREVVRASARLQAAESLLALGAREPAQFAEAAREAQRFLADFPTNREVPVAALLHARALHLGGEPAEAATAYRAIHARLAGDQAATGWQRAQCFRAGVEAAQALLAVPDTLGARELFTSVAASLGPIVAGLEDSPEKRELSDVLAEATVGEGFVELAAGNARQALTFFQGQERALTAQSSDAQRYAVLLGLGASLLADGQARQAQIALAQVSALDSASPDRVARALLLQADAGLKLGDPRDGLKPLLATVDRDFGNTPWATAARAMLQKL